MTEEELILFLQVLAVDATGKAIKQEYAKAIAERIMSYKKEETNDRRT